MYRRHNRHNRDIRLSGTQCCCKSVAVAAAPIAARRAADKRRECIQCNYDVSRRSRSARSFFSPVFFFFLLLFFSASRARARPSVRVHNHSSLKCSVQRAALHHHHHHRHRYRHVCERRTPRDFIYRSARLHRLRPRIYIVSLTSRPLSNRHSRIGRRQSWLNVARQFPIWNNGNNKICNNIINNVRQQLIL